LRAAETAEVFPLTTGKISRGRWKTRMPAGLWMVKGDVMTETANIPTGQLAENFRSTLEGTLDEERLRSGAETLEAAAMQKYYATGSCVSFIFYMQFRVQIHEGSRWFHGHAGGITNLSGGALIGEVYTADRDRLYRDTVSFAFTAVPAYTALYFFDAHSNLLGTFQAGAVSFMTGTCGGTGSWS
jgi:hypothetical protein